MELKQNLSALEFNAFSQALTIYINELKKSGNYDNVSLDAISSKVEPTIYYHFLPYKIKELFDKQEDIISTLDTVTSENWKNPYSKEKYTFQKKNGMLYPYIKRWFDWLKYNLDYIGCIAVIQEPLLTIENDVTEQVYDINNEAIILESTFN